MGSRSGTSPTSPRCCSAREQHAPGRRRPRRPRVCLRCPRPPLAPHDPPRAAREGRHDDLGRHCPALRPLVADRHTASPAPRTSEAGSGRAAWPRAALPPRPAAAPGGGGRVGGPLRRRHDRRAVRVTPARATGPGLGTGGEPADDAGGCGRGWGWGWGTPQLAAAPAPGVVAEVEDGVARAFVILVRAPASSSTHSGALVHPVRLGDRGAQGVGWTGPLPGGAPVSYALGQGFPQQRRCHSCPSPVGTYRPSAWHHDWGLFPEGGTTNITFITRPRYPCWKPPCLLDFSTAPST